MSTKLFTFSNQEYIAIVEITPHAKDGGLVRRAVLTVGRLDSPQNQRLYASFDATVDAKYERDWIHWASDEQIVVCMLDTAGLDDLGPIERAG